MAAPIIYVSGDKTKRPWTPKSSRPERCWSWLGLMDAMSLSVRGCTRRTTRKSASLAGTRRGRITRVSPSQPRHVWACSW